MAVAHILEDIPWLVERGSLKIGSISWKTPIDAIGSSIAPSTSSTRARKLCTTLIGNNLRWEGEKSKERKGKAAYRPVFK